MKALALFVLAWLVTGTAYAACPVSPTPTTPPSPCYKALTVDIGPVSGGGFVSLFASPPAIGGTAPATGAFTVLTAGTPTGAAPSTGDVDISGAFKVNGVSVGTGPFCPLAGCTYTGAVNLGAGGSLTGTFSGNPIWSGAPSFTGTVTWGTTTQAGSQINMRSAANNLQQSSYFRGAVHQWDFQVAPVASSSIGADSPWLAFAYKDNSAFSGTLFSAERSSGSLFTGGPYWSKFSPYQLNTIKATRPNGVYGNDIQLSGTNGTAAGDTQPAIAIPGGFFSNSNSTINVFCTGCGLANAPLDNTKGEVWVKIVGSTAWNGVDLNTMGLNGSNWYKVLGIAANQFSISISPAVATGTGAGGGASATVQPSFAAVMSNQFTIVTTGAVGFPAQNQSTYISNPLFFQPNGTNNRNPNYQQYYDHIYSPNDTTGLYQYITIDRELDVTSRNIDVGYSSLFSSTQNPVAGYFLDPWSDVDSAFIPGGGVGHNVYGAYLCGENEGTSARVGFYKCLDILPETLVGNGFDPTTHGGVGVDYFGAYTDVLTNGFATTIGTKTITISLHYPTRQLMGMVNGNQIWIPGTYSISGVTFGGASYAITCTASPCTAGTIQITGDGSNAAASTTGGGTTPIVFFPRQAPYAPMQIAGESLHGIIVSQTTKFDDGLVVHSIPVTSTNPGGGIGWDDGTATCAASVMNCAYVTGTQISAGHVSVDMNPTAGDPINAGGPLRLKSYTVATLPSCGAAMKGAMAYVTDAAAVPVYNANVAGGGSVILPVFCNATVWSNH